MKSPSVEFLKNGECFDNNDGGSTWLGKGTA